MKTRIQAYLITALLVVGFFIGIYNKEISTFLYRQESFIGFLVCIILSLIFYIFRLKDKHRMMVNSYHYSDSTNNELRNQKQYLEKEIDWWKSFSNICIEKMDSIIKENKM